jgi:hypothetical protein
MHEHLPNKSGIAGVVAAGLPHPETRAWPTAETTRQRPGESEIRWANRTFAPHFPGVHLCGSDHEDNRVFTIANFPARSDEQAKELWDALKAECEVEEEAGDFLVDLNTVAGHEDDFWCSRQMLPRIEAITRLSTQGEAR